MQIHQLVSEVVANTKGSLWPAFAPELIICATILLLLLIRVFNVGRLIPPSLFMVVGSAVALYFAYPWKHLADPSLIGRQELFTGMLVYDSFTVYIRAILLFFGVLFALFTILSGVPNREDSADFYCLVLGSMLGMCLMASANHLLMIFLAIEMASVPSYALAGILKTNRSSSEAALKYSIYGAGAAGIMLYGISLIAGVLSSAHIPTLAIKLAEMLPALSSSEVMVLALGGLMLMVGLAFKLSAVPFHFWCPDVFEGASAEINAFLSVASKAAALALLVRVACGFGLLPAETTAPGTATPAIAVAANGGLFAVGDEIKTVNVTSNASRTLTVADAAEEPASEFPKDVGPLAPVRQFICLVVGIFAAITCTFGNLAAYGQTNIKRLMAYSTIAHAGYMMLPVPAAMAMAGVDPAGAKEALASMSLYIAIYLFMNLGAFSIIAFLRNSLHSEEIADYAGLVRRAPFIVVMFAVILFSLVGIPPLAGFVGKFAIFASLANAYGVTGKSFLLILLLIGGLNTVISLFYYLRVVKVMAIDPESDRASSAEMSLMSPLSGVYVFAVTLPLIGLFLSWETLNAWTLAAAQHLF